MRAITALTAILSVCLVTSALGRGPTVQDPGADSPSKARVDALMQRIRQGGADAGAWEQIRDEVDLLLSRVDGSEPSRTIEDRLRRLLAGHEPNPEYSRRPLARVADLRHGRSIVITYVILRGQDQDVAVIRGLVEDSDGRFVPVASLAEFEGHGLFVEELPSPVDGEAWFIGWGRAQGANRNEVRVRVFSFDGSGFHVLWSPSDMNDVTVAVTSTGFELTHSSADINPPMFVRDEFVLTPAGPDRLGSTVLDDVPVRRH